MAKTTREPISARVFMSQGSIGRSAIAFRKESSWPVATYIKVVGSDDFCALSLDFNRIEWLTEPETLALDAIRAILDNVGRLNQADIGKVTIQKRKKGKRKRVSTQILRDTIPFEHHTYEVGSISAADCDVMAEKHELLLKKVVHNMKKSLHHDWHVYHGIPFQQLALA